MIQSHTLSFNLAEPDKASTPFRPWPVFVSTPIVPVSGCGNLDSQTFHGLSVALLVISDSQFSNLMEI